jgi:hypothetical protein
MRSDYWSWEEDQLRKEVILRGRKTPEVEQLGQFHIVRTSVVNEHGSARAVFEGSGLTRFTAYANLLDLLDSYGVTR